MSSRTAIESATTNLEESMGVRVVESHPQLSPAPKAKDKGRRPLRSFGTVAVDQIIPDPDQPRKAFEEKSLIELAASIKSKGQLQPIRVRWSELKQKWIIIGGERRWRATKLAGLEKITCHFHDAPLSDSEILEEQIIENIHRRSLQPIEEAKSFDALMQLNNWTGKQVAEALRIHPAKVSRSLALLKLPDDIQKKVIEGKLASRSAYEISKIEDDDRRRAMADESAQGLTSQQTAKRVRQQKGKKKTSRRSRRVSLQFQTESGWSITAKRSQMGNYHEVEHALVEVLEEVRHRINNNVKLF